MFSVPRLTSAVVAIAALTLASPLVAQSVSTLYLKDGGTLRGYIVDDSDPTSVRVKSEKSGTVFMLKRAWIDSIALPPARVQAAQAQPAPAQPAPSQAQPIGSQPRPQPVAIQSTPVQPKPEPVPAAAPTPAPAPAAAVAQQSEPSVAIDALEPPPAKAPKGKVKEQKQKSSANYKPSKWYIGGGGAAYTGEVGSIADIGYGGMIGYGTGVGNALAVRVGGSGSYWQLANNAGDFYDLAGNIDFVIGPRSPRFLSPYAVVGGLGGVRSASSTQVGVTGYSRDPLYGARGGLGVSAKRIFVEVSYQQVWVDGISSGYVPFVLGFRF